MELSGGKNIRSVEGPMDLRILWVYEGILLANLSSDLAFFWSGEGIRRERKRGVLDVSPVSRNYSPDYCTTILLGRMRVQVGSTTNSTS